MEHTKTLSRRHLPKEQIASAHARRRRPQTAANESLAAIICGTNMLITPTALALRCPLSPGLEPAPFYHTREKVLIQD